MLSSPEDFFRLLVDGDREPAERRLNPTQVEFWSDPAYAKAYMGPAGCAKTSTVVADTVARAIFEPGSKHLIARNDYNDLMDTTFKRFTEMIDRLPPGTVVDRTKQAPAKYWLRPATINGSEPEDLSEITFMGLKGGLGSYEFTSAAVDEASEAEESAVVEIFGRLRVKKGHRSLSVCFNPPDKHHWLYEACTGLDAHDEKTGEPIIFKLFQPTPRENIRNLPENYYENMAERMPEDMRQRFVDGAWGSTFPGDPVIRQYRAPMHNGDTKWERQTLFRFWDFGYNRPAVLYCQVSTQGHLHVMREYLGHRQTGELFIQKVLADTQQYFPGAKNTIDFGDPAVAQVKDTGSMLQLLQTSGILIRYQDTPLDISMAVLRKRFELLLEGYPAIIIDRREAPILAGGLRGGYHFKKDGVTPHKDGYYDHLIDCLRYGIFNLFGLSMNVRLQQQLPISLSPYSLRN